MFVAAMGAVGVGMEGDDVLPRVYPLVCQALGELFLLMVHEDLTKSGGGYGFVEPQFRTSALRDLILAEAQKRMASPAIRQAFVDYVAVLGMPWDIPVSEAQASSGVSVGLTDEEIQQLQADQAAFHVGLVGAPITMADMARAAYLGTPVDPSTLSLQERELLGLSEVRTAAGENMAGTSVIVESSA